MASLKVKSCHIGQMDKCQEEKSQEKFKSRFLGKFTALIILRNEVNKSSPYIIFVPLIALPHYELYTVRKFQEAQVAWTKKLRIQ